MLNSEDVEFISSMLTFWNKLSNNEKNLIINNSVFVNYKKGENIHSGENDCIGVLLIKSGTLRTYMLSEKGKEITLYRLYKGDVCILSASCIIKNITFDVHIDAETDSKVLLINSAIFATLSEKNIYVENFSYKVAIDNFSSIMWAMEQILFMSFDKRLAIFLLNEISKTNTNTISLTHEQIARYMGSAREVVSRMIKHFESDGIVELSRGSVKVLDVPKLQTLI